MMIDMSFFLLGLNVNSTLVDDGGAGLPAGAIAYANFKNGTYHYGGNALSDFLTQNTDWGTFDPNVVIPHIGIYGYLAQNRQPVFGPALTTQCLASGFTAVVTFISGRMIVGATDLPNENQFVAATAHVSVGDSELFAVDTHYPYTFSPSDEMHRMAFTYTSTHSAVCIDGGEVVSANYAALDAVNAVVFDGAYSWADITLYPAKLDADLVTLTTFDAGVIPAINSAYTLPATANVGDMLTPGAGTWLNSPSTVTFAWSRNSTGTYLGSAATYVTQPTDSGDSITLDIFAENAAGYAHFTAVTNIT